MILNTHLLFSRIILKSCLRKTKLKLDKMNFMYGNIKPDIFSEDPNDSHSLEDNEGTVRRYINKLKNRKLTKEEFSLTLGMLCHYTCDFFCIYHRKEFKNESMLSHIIYEIKLHLKLLMLLFTGKLKILRDLNMHKKDSMSMILEMRKKYQAEKESIMKDITFAISTAIMISKAIVPFKRLKLKNNKISMLQKYKLPRGMAGAV